MDPALAALIGAALGGGISYLTSWTQLRRQQANERRRLLLLKMEETYQAGLSVQDGYRTAWGEIASRLSVGEFRGEERLEKIRIDRVRMLVELFLPEVEPLVANLETKASDFGSVVGECVLAIDQPEETRSQLQIPLLDAFNAVDGACRELLTAVARLSVQHLE